MFCCCVDDIKFKIVWSINKLAWSNMIAYNIDMPIPVTHLHRTFILYLSGVWFDVAPKMDTVKTHVYKILDCMLKS